MDLESELSSSEKPVDLSALEREFKKAAKAYSERKGISYSAWRELGVPPSVLASAGITRSAKS